LQSQAAGTPVAVPASNVNGITVGNGFVEASARQVVRTVANKVYVITADDDPCLSTSSPTKGVIHVWKGTGSQAGNANVPTGFSEMDAANRPVPAGTGGSCQFSGGVTNMLLSPDSRLDSSGNIQMAYIDGNNGNVYYQTFSTATDTWGGRVQIGSGALTDSGSGWPRGGQLALTLDANDVPHVVFCTSGTSNSLKYTNKTSGSWSAAATIASGTNLAHPSLATSLDGTIHLAWLVNSHAAHSSISYAHYSGGAWGTSENVSSGDSVVLGNGDDDQGPSIATDSQNRPHVLFDDGTVNGSDNYARLRYRTTGGVWTDDSPPGTTGGAASASGNWFNHTPQNYISSVDDEYVFLGHDVNISPGVYEYQTGGPGNNWSSAKQLDPRNSTNTTAGAPGLDGSASIRWDPLRDNNPGIIDVLYYDENDGTAGYDHHATVYYKAVDISSTLPTGPQTTYVSPTGNDSTCARGDQSKPCLSLNKAYAIAQCNDLVSVADGTYTSQTITNSKACTSSTPVKFVAASGQPTFDNVNVKASYVWIEGMKVPHSLAGTSVGFWNVEAPEPGNLPSAVSYVTLKNDEGGGLYIFAEHVDVLGGSYGGFSACLTGQEDLTRIWQENIASSGSDYRASSYITFDGVTIHDGTDNGNKCGDAVNGPHVDAMQILGGHNITIRKSFFYNCPTSCIIGSGFRTGEDNYLIENNFFQQEANPGATLNFSYSSSGDPDTGQNMVIRYNTTNGTIATGCTSTSPSCWKVYGNVAGAASCTNATWTYNAVANGLCTGGGGRTCTPSFVGPTPQSSYGSTTIPNFNLNPSDTCAADVVPTSANSYPSTDRFGTIRPQGTNLDIGAYEITGGGGGGGGDDTTAPTVSFLAPTNGATVSGVLSEANNNCKVNAADNVGINHVNYYLDGNLINTEMTAPYTCDWDTTTAANGSSHILKATAYDSANNNTSVTITVTVNNGGAVQGDLNNDGHVTILDLSILLSHYGQSATASQGDINNDGTCNILDLSILLSHYGT